MDLIECRLCGKFYQLLNSHLKYVHGLLVSEYLAMFPHALTSAPSVIESISKSVSLTFSKMSGRLSEIQRTRFANPLERQKTAETTRRWWASRSEGEKREHLEKSFHSKQARDKLREFHRGMSKEERLDWVSRSFHSPEARKLAVEGMRVGLKKWWASLPPDRKLREIEKRVMPSRLACAYRPSKPEMAVGVCLNSKFPGEWLYNGDGTGGIIIGSKIPDFVNINGKKAVIEVFGNYWHNESEVEPLKEHYRKYGFDCYIIWESECWSEESLEKAIACIGK